MGMVLARLKGLIHRAVRTLGYDVVQTEDIYALGPHLRALFVLLGINCVIDIGGHLGEFGLLLRNLGYTGEIVSLEPLLASFAVLSAVAARDGHWQVHRVAVGDRDGSADLHVTEGTEMASFLPPNSYATEQFGARVAVRTTETVPMRRLDGLLDRLVAHVPNARIFLKLDTQGYDIKVLEGASGSLQRVAALQSEVSVKPIYDGMTALPDALLRFRQCGFELTGLFPVSRDSDRMRLVELDCVMMRPLHRPTAPGA